MSKDKVLEAFEAAWKASGKNPSRFVERLKMFEHTLLKANCDGKKVENTSEDESKYRFRNDWNDEQTSSYDVRMTDGDMVWLYDDCGQLVKEDVSYLLPTEALWLANEITHEHWKEQSDTNND